MMKTLDLYILRRVFWPLAAALGVTVLALLLERLVRLLDLLVNKGGPLSLLVQMLTNLIPHYLGIALPAAFFVAVLLAIMRLSQSSEIHAMQAAGISLWRLIAPILVLAAGLTALNAVTINYLQPHARYAYRAATFALINNAWNIAVETGVFFTGFRDTVILVDGLDDDGTTITGIFAYRRDDPGRATVITAHKGVLSSRAGAQPPALHLFRGLRTEIGPGASEPNAVRFERFDLTLDFAVAPKQFRTRGRDEEELTLDELWAARAQPPEGVAPALIRAEIHHRLVRSLTILVLPFLAVPLAIASGQARRTRNLSLGFGLIVIVVYHYILQLGYSLASVERLSPYIGLWLPFGLLAGGSLWSFIAAGRRPEGNLLADALARLDGAVRLVYARRGWQRGAG
ncbi:MAG: LPS export ABC transporter permease LptF [Alphaproteobacteria bacterium]|nr:MAG: LPS export ABC transporter permease LptF [Alphaproteobacteria bacterium]